MACQLNRWCLRVPLCTLLLPAAARVVQRRACCAFFIFPFCTTSNNVPPFAPCLLVDNIIRALFCLFCNEAPRPLLYGGACERATPMTPPRHEAE